jgi:hypothetical protein
MLTAIKASFDGSTYGRRSRPFDEETPVQIELARTVAARPQAVFATVADVETWPRILRSVRSVELLTPGSLRVGTRLCQQRVMFGRETTEEMEVIKIERTRRLRLAAKI